MANTAGKVPSASQTNNDILAENVMAHGKTTAGDIVAIQVNSTGQPVMTLAYGEDSTNDVIRVEQQFEYETVAASQTAQVLGGAGAIGDLLHSIIITASTGTITVLDNAVSVAVIPAAATGVWLFDLVSVSGAWKITTAAATSCTATGRFT